MAEPQEWRPGSFTKNFSWGSLPGLARLHQAIRLGFADELIDVPRRIFIERMKPAGLREYVPLNFFLFNKVINGQNFVAVDELIFQALNFDHSDRFDKLALFAFNFSYVGNWTGGRQGQDRPALWAQHYITDRLARDHNWDVTKIGADDIETFLLASPQFKAVSSHRKVATNLNYIYQRGHLAELADARVERWWVDALFLALDRLLSDRERTNSATAPSQFEDVLNRSTFHFVTGKRSLEKDLATKHLIALYQACGARERFSEERIRERTELLLPDLDWFLANDPRPRGAVHPTNPRILKAIPTACAMLAKYAGFEVISPDELEELEPDEFIKRQTRQALERLQALGVRPTMSAEDVMQATRGHREDGKKK